MIISCIKLKNWRNFRDVEVPLTNRVFLAGPNASGKSNFLDVFRFLKDIVRTGGGLQQAIQERGGLLHQMQFWGSQDHEGIEIEVHLAEDDIKPPQWKYAIRIIQSFEHQEPFLAYEKVWLGEIIVLNRNMMDEEEDPELWTRTHLEHPQTNQKFREIADFFDTISYLHVVPQLLRHPKAFKGQNLPGDPYGKELLDRFERSKKRKSNLLRIQQALQKAVPQLKKIEYKEEDGRPHLEAVFDTSGAKKIKPSEDQFSDGTLRLIGLFWAILEGDGTLLLEEPELSLNTAIVRALVPIIYRLQKNKAKPRQVMISTHSSELLSDEGIGANEVLLLTPDKKGTQIKPASSIQDIKALLEGGLNIGEAIAPYAEPQNFDYPPLFLK